MIGSGNGEWEQEQEVREREQDQVHVCVCVRVRDRVHVREWGMGARIWSSSRVKTSWNQPKQLNSNVIFTKE
jgi:hypothetical protein